LAYAAGFLDGEGCFYIEGAPHHKIRVSAANTDEGVIRWLQSLFGGSVSQERRQRNPNHRPVWSWQVVSRDAWRMCCTVVPYLKQKAEQALLLIATQQTKGNGGPGTVTSEVRSERQWYADRAKELKYVSS